MRLGVQNDDFPLYIYTLSRTQHLQYDCGKAFFELDQNSHVNIRICSKISSKKKSADSQRKRQNRHRELRPNNEKYHPSSRRFTDIVNETKRTKFFPLKKQ